MNDTKAQLSQNMLESIANQTKVLTSAQIEVGDIPIEIYTSTDATYAANFRSNTVSVIDSDTNTVIKNVTVGAYPFSITSSMNAVYVANGESNTVSVINPANNTVIKNIEVGASPGIIYGFGDTVYVANGESNNVSDLEILYM